jgi:hypothetical protein
VDLLFDHFADVISFFIFRGTVMNTEEKAYDNSEREEHDAGQKKEECYKCPAVAID